MTASNTFVLTQLEQLESVLQPDESVEVRDLAARAPEDVTVAVIGPHNAGKTTLIAAVTADPKALEDISAKVQTQVSRAYKYANEEVTFCLWDTPGLGSEHLEHDDEARKRITSADAVALAVSTDLISDAGRSQLDELLNVGRKRGAAVAVVTKSDREPRENRAGIRDSFLLALPEYGSELRFVSARQVLDAWEDGTEPPKATGVPELKRALEDLALGEAQRRQEATAAIRLLVLIDRAEERLTVEEPEREVELRFQRRLRKILTRTDQQLVRSLDTARRKARLAAFRATAHIAQSLDSRATREALEVAVAEAWDAFAEERAKLEAELSSSWSRLLDEASAELERLEAGPLAEELKASATSLNVDPLDTGDAADPVGWETAQALLKAAKRAAELLDRAKLGIKVKGKPVPVRLIAEVLLAGAEEIAEQQQAKAVAEAKDSYRGAYAERAATLAEQWKDSLDAIRDETTRAALSRSDQTEQELFQQLHHVKEQLEQVASSRKTLESFVTDAVASGYADES